MQHHADCTMIDGRGRVCSSACPIGTPQKRSDIVLSHIAKILNESGEVGTVHENAKAHGHPSTVLVLSDGSAYRISVAELREAVSGEPQVPVLELGKE